MSDFVDNWSPHLAMDDESSNSSIQDFVRQWPILTLENGLEFDGDIGIAGPLENDSYSQLSQQQKYASVEQAPPPFEMGEAFEIQNIPSTSQLEANCQYEPPKPPAQAPAMSRFFIEEDGGDFQPIYHKDTIVFQLGGRFYVRHLFTPTEWNGPRPFYEQEPAENHFAEYALETSQNGPPQNIYWQRAIPVQTESGEVTLNVFSKFCQPTVTTAVQVLPPPAPADQPVVLINNNKGGQGVDEGNFYNLPVLPISSIKDWQIYESRVRTDSKLRSELHNQLTKIGGRNEDHCVRNMMKAVITHDFRRKWNWEGRGKRLPFKNSVIKDIMFDAVRESFPQAKDFSLKAVVQRWLKQSGKRPC